VGGECPTIRGAVMPADGAGAVPSARAVEGASEPSAVEATRRHDRGRRTRVRRFVAIVYGVTAVLHVAPILAATLFVPPLAAVAGGMAVFVVTSLRLRALVREKKRPRWLTVLFDEPVLGHWCASLLATFLLPVTAILALLLGALGAHEARPSRAIAVAALVSYAFSAVVAAWGFTVRRRWIQVAYVDVPIPGLAQDLDGYRIAHVSDLHIGNYDTKARGLEWARRVNALSPDLVAVTGDLVTTGSAFYDDVAHVIGAMRSKDGVFVSLGNHDQHDPDTLSRLIEEGGAVVLRNASSIVRRGQSELVVAGVDDRMTGKDDIERTLEGRTAGVPTVLLAHYPEFFEEAAPRGVELVLSGHTHGGQIALPFATRRVSLSRLAKQPTAGLHVRGQSRLYVNRGLGTTGPPVRLGVAPEIAVLTLRRA
jgi:predicted MPP superfamily phosphohydrolase